MRPSVRLVVVWDDLKDEDPGRWFVDSVVISPPLRSDPRPPRRNPLYSPDPPPPPPPPPRWNFQLPNPLNSGHLSLFPPTNCWE